jgi:hypothetical protein
VFEEFFRWFGTSANSYAEGVQSSLICNEIVEVHSCNWSVFCNFLYGEARQAVTAVQQLAHYRLFAIMPPPRQTSPS